MSGFVTSDAGKVLASEEAGSVAGVKTVLNNLTVQQPGAPAAAAAPPDAARPAPGCDSHPNPSPFRRSWPRHVHSDSDYRPNPLRILAPMMPTGIFSIAMMILP
jgi:hypothetical protein